VSAKDAESTTELAQLVVFVVDMALLRLNLGLGGDEVSNQAR
jgi:hypothetical protein